MNILSWNVNGVRAAVKKGFLEKLPGLNADIVCLQETKAQDDQVREALFGIDDYHVFSNSAERKGYSGTAILSKEQPLEVIKGIGNNEHDNEGRVLTLEYADFYVVNVYVPNSGRELIRLDYRKTWDESFLGFLKELEKRKPVLVGGDFNVAHQPIDIARPKSNYNKTAGYTQVEIDGFTTMVDSGLTDTFRHFYPDKIAYSWWSMRANARQKNIGWRIDYFLTSKSWMNNVRSAFILPDVIGSDHCPVGITI